MNKQPSPYFLEDGVRPMMHDVRQDESLGIRLHEVNRHRAVDRAVERMRYALGADWLYLTTDDHDTLRWIAGELWEVTARGDWEALHFSKLDFSGIQRLIGIGDRLRRHKTGRTAALESAVQLVQDEFARPLIKQGAGAEPVYLA